MANGLRSPKGTACPPYSNGPYEHDQILVRNKPCVDGADRYVLEENFSQLPGVNADIAPASADDAADGATAAEIALMMAKSKHFEVLGTNASSDDVTFATTVGGLQLQTDGADNDQVIILPHLDTGQTAWANVLWGTENQVIWEAIIKTDSAITTQTIWAGLKLTNTSVIATDADQVFFRYAAAADTNWQCINSIGGTDVSGDSGVVVAASKIYYFRIEIDADRKAHFFINNKEIYVTAALTNDVDLIPYVGIHANTDAAKSLYLVKQKISRYVYE